MQRFILRQNIGHFERLLALETDEALRLTLQRLAVEERRKLAQAEAVLSGIEHWSLSRLRNPGGLLGRAGKIISAFQHDFEISASPFLVLDPNPGLHIVDINEAYADVTMAQRGKVAGERLFDVFPDNPEDPAASGVNNLYQSLQSAARTGAPHNMAVQRYDVRDASGRFVERYWRPVNTPLLDEEGHLIFLLHHVEDVTDEMLRQPPKPGTTQSP
jgi:PAS domain-containing protein